MRTYYVYILASTSRVLYVGVTSNLHRRILQHRQKVRDCFSSKYQVTRLVYFESTGNILAAIAREKQIKAFRREKKLRLVESMNRGWLDLAINW